MSTHRQIDKICWAAIIFAVLLAAAFICGNSFGIAQAETEKAYEAKLFDTEKVHTVDIVMDDFEGFLDTCTEEAYAQCKVVIDGEAFSNVAIRGKGNTSLTQVEQYGNDRYSFKLEFDHYDASNLYYGLDKVCLNNVIQDNTYMKDYLTYQMMEQAGADAPLCSFVYITVNGQDWGLYVAVEGVEESFLERNYGSNYGNLYKPDSQSMEQPGEKKLQGDADSEGSKDTKAVMGSADVSLQYTDDSYDSYANIFDNAKTEITSADKDRLIASLKGLSAQENLEDIVDIEAVIRYFVVHNFVCNFDSYTGSMIHNYYLYESEGKLSMIPWDYNLAFGGFQGVQDAGALINYPIDTPVSGGSLDSRPMLAWIFAKEEYTQLYHQYFSEFLADYFESGVFAETFAKTKELIAPYVEKDPTKFCTYEEFEEGIEALENFCLLRAESISGQLSGTIAATAQAQQEAGDEGMVDPGDLDISAMGTMEQNQNEMPGGGTPPEPPDGAGSDSAPFGQEMPEQNTDMSPGQEMSGQEESGQMQPPQDDTVKRGGMPGEQMPESEPVQTVSKQLLLLAASILILLGGLLAAALYRR